MLGQNVKEEYDKSKNNTDTIDNTDNIHDTSIVPIYREESNTLSNIKDIDMTRGHKIIRVIPNDERMTSHIMTIEEITEAIGIRASQIENGMIPLVDIDNLNNPIDIAKKELLERESPLILERAIAETDNEILVEQWDINTMAYIHLDRESLDNYKIAKNKYDKTINASIEL